MKSTFFYEGHNIHVARQLHDYVNTVPEILSVRSLASTRAAGDALQDVVADKLVDFLGTWSKECTANFARRAMADIAYTDKEGFYCVVDVKTHREDTKFNMPNLTSVERLSRFYESDENVFAVIMLKYQVSAERVLVTEVTFVPIEFLSWDCLTIGALGWGQIQIANSNRIVVNSGFSRKKWMLGLCDAMLEFYPKEIAKIEHRMTRFQTIREQWEKRKDVW